MRLKKNICLLNDLSYLFVILFVVSLPFSIIVNSVSIIALLIIKLLLIYFEQNISIQQDNKTLFFSTITIFTLYVVSLIWSNNFYSGLFLIEKRLSFLVFPIIFFLKPQPLNKSQFHKVLTLFTFIILIGCLFSHIYVAFDMIEKDFPISKWNSWWYTSSNLSGIIGLHSTYLSIYINLASLICLYFLISEKKKLHIQFLLVIIIGYLLIYNLLLSSRLNMLFGILMVSVLGSYYVKKTLKSRLMFFVFIILLTSSLVYTIISMPYLKSKFNQSIVYFFAENSTEKINNNSTSGHLNAWKCSLESIKLNSFLLGFGIGDTNEVLTDCYYKNNYDYNLKNNFNAHNEFLQIFLSIGIVGVFLICILFIKSFNKNKLLINLFLLLILVSFVSESVLSRHKGIVFFMFFLCFLNSHNNYIKDLIKKNNI